MPFRRSLSGSIANHIITARRGQCTWGSIAIRPEVSAVVKRCIWEVGTAEKPERSLVDRAPKIQRGGKMSDDQEKESRRNAYIYILKTLALS